LKKEKTLLKNLKILFTLTADSAADISETRTADISKQCTADVSLQRTADVQKDNL
jgi:hypothetical protein